MLFRERRRDDDVDGAADGLVLECEEVEWVGVTAAVDPAETGGLSVEDMLCSNACRKEGQARCNLFSLMAGNLLRSCRESTTTPRHPNDVGPCRFRRLIVRHDNWKCDRSRVRMNRSAPALRPTETS